MKKIAILFAALLLCAFTAVAQNSSNASSSANGTDTNNTDTTKQQQRNTATSDEMAAQSAKDRAKNASGASAEHDKALARLDEGGKVLNQLLTAPDNGIPGEVMDSAKCVAVIPSMLKGGFIFGAEHGRGVATCRTGKGWSAPAFFTATGGNWGAQIGGQATDLVMLFMTQQGAEKLLNSKFKIGADASAAAGPVGREASASTNWKMQNEILTYSRSRGLYAGAVLNGVVVKPDEDAMTGYYGHDVGFRPVLTGQVKDPRAATTALSLRCATRTREATAQKEDKK